MTVRDLNPAVEYLEADLDLDCGSLTKTSADLNGLVYTWSTGARMALGTLTIRPMFSVIDDLSNAYRTNAQCYRPCPACYDFSRSWNCPAHPEQPHEEWI